MFRFTQHQVLSSKYKVASSWNLLLITSNFLLARSGGAA
jgi:hypothetical protein